MKNGYFSKSIWAVCTIAVMKKMPACTFSFSLRSRRIKEIFRKRPDRKPIQLSFSSLIYGHPNKVNYKARKVPEIACPL